MLTDSDLRHSLAHMEIGEPVVRATIIDDRFTAAALQNFFMTLRNGHRVTLAGYKPELATIIGQEEHHELDACGPFGKFVGRIAMNESGIIAVENALHHGDTTDIQEKLRLSLTTAAANLRAQ